MTPFLLVNPSSGDDSPTAAELCGAASERGIRTHVLGPDDDPVELAWAADAGPLGVAGGDGSLAPVAEVALERDLPFVCVPFGTRNHFARDLGLDRDDPLGALAAFDGEERRVDVGRAGGRLFLNNVSLGLYAGLVTEREHHRRRGAALAGTRALWRLAGSRHRFHVRVDGQPMAVRILLVANNAYETHVFNLGGRERLDEGELHLYAAHGLLPRDWSEREGPRFTIDWDGGDARAAVDGEPLELETPLVVESVPRALRVLVPRV